MQSVAIVDYGSGNLRSAAKALERAAAESGVAARVAVTADAATVARADRIILPGVGAFADCMAGLAALPGMREVLEEQVRRRGKPFFGICVGMQLLAETSSEHGRHPGLGWIAADVAPVANGDGALKVPHMGWNELQLQRPHPVFAGIAAGDHAYFVHSYSVRCHRLEEVLATVAYGGPVTAAVARENVVGTQFHPEKSQAVGLRVLANFLRWEP